MANAPYKKKSQDFRDRNLRSLRQRMPQIDEQLLTPTPGVQASSIHTPSAQISLTLRREKRLIHIHSTYDPGAEARHWAEDAGKEEWQIGVVFGFGLGYHLEDLHRMFPDRTLVVVEPLPDILNLALTVRDLSALMHDANFSFVMSNDAHVAARSLFSNHLRNNVLRGRIVFFAWPPYQRVWSNFWRQMQQHIGELIRQASVNIATYQYFSMQWQENFFTNLRASVIDPSVKSLYSLFAGKPAILVSAGPSLQKNIHLLAEAQEKALIVAAGSAIGPLLANGIKPHLVVSFDGAAANYYVFANLDTSDLPLVYSSVIYPRIIAEYAGPRFALGVDIYPFERWFYEQLDQDRGNVSSGPSVANLTWDLLRQMACDPIIFVGQDLAFGFDGQTHAAGRVELDFEIDKPESTPGTQQTDDGFEWVEDVWGNRVRTRPVWLAMKIWFEQRMRIAGKGHTFINATEGGAKIVGARIMTLRETLDTYCNVSFDAKKLIWETHHRATSQLATQHLDTKLNSLLQQIGDEFAQILRICDEAEEPLRVLNERNREQKLTPDDFVRFHAILSQLDFRLSDLEVYKHFVSISIVNSITAFNAMSALLRAERDFEKKGQQLAELYAALFMVVRKTVLDLQSYHRLAAENPLPYAPPSLATELAHISRVCDEMQPLVDRLNYLATLPLDVTVRAGVESSHLALEDLAAQINQTEIMRWFVKEILEKQVANIERLQATSTSVNKETDLKRKTEYLAEYHSLFLRLIQDAVAEIRTYSRIPV